MIFFTLKAPPLYFQILVWKPDLPCMTLVFLTVTMSPGFIFKRMWFSSEFIKSSNVLIALYSSSTWKWLWVHLGNSGQLGHPTWVHRPLWSPGQWEHPSGNHEQSGTSWVGSTHRAHHAWKFVFSSSGSCLKICLFSIRIGWMSQFETTRDCLEWICNGCHVNTMPVFENKLVLLQSQICWWGRGGWMWTHTKNGCWEIESNLMKSFPTSLKLATVLESSWYLKHQGLAGESKPVIHFWVIFACFTFLGDFCGGF